MSATCENPHLCRTANRLVFRPHRQEADGITESRGHTCCPRLKLSTCPLEAMVFVAQFARGQSLKFAVVLDVGCCYHNRLRVCEFKHNSFEGGKARRVLMFNNFYNSRGVVPGEARILIGQGTVKQTNSLFLHCRQIVKMQSLSGDLQDAVRDIQADNFCERLVFQKLAQKSAFATAKIKDALRAGASKRG